MREIKFRCWDSSNKNGMVYFGSAFDLDDDKNTLTFFADNGNILGDYNEDGKRFVLMQFTGLHDKNGKEIYFGDILQTSNDGSDGCDVWDKDDYGYAVCFEDPEKLGVRFRNWYPTTDEESIYNFKYCEVIGNIWENSELIK